MTLFGLLFGNLLAFGKHISEYLNPKGTKQFYEIFYLALLDSFTDLKKTYPPDSIQQIINIEAIFKAPKNRVQFDKFFEVEIINISSFRGLLTNKNGLKQLTTYLLEIIESHNQYLDVADADIIIAQTLERFSASILNQISNKQGIVAILEQGFENQNALETIKRNLSDLGPKIEKIREGQEKTQQLVLSGNEEVIKKIDALKPALENLNLPEYAFIEKNLMPYLNQQLENGKKLLKERSPEQALTILKDLYKSFAGKPISPQFFSTVELNIGNCYAQLNDLDNSARYHIKATQTDPTNIEFLYNAANAYQHLGQDDAIKEVVQKILALEPDSVKGYALQLLTQDIPDDVEELIQTIPKKYIKSTEVLMALSWICSQRNRTDLQLKCLKKALKKTPNNEQIKLYLAYLLASKHIQQIRLIEDHTLSAQEIKDLKTSKKLYLDIWNKVKKTPSAKRKIDILLNISTIYFKLNKTDKALKLLEKHTVIGAKNVHFQFHKTLFLYDLGERKAAIEIAKKADLDKIPDFYLLLAELLYNTKEITEAIKYIKLFIEKHPSSLNHRRAQYFYIISLINADRVVEAQKILD